MISTLLDQFYFFNKDINWKLFISVINLLLNLEKTKDISFYFKSLCKILINGKSTVKT